MNRYVITRRFRQANGKLGDYQDFAYAKGIKEARKYAGGPLHLSRNATMEKGTAVYIGENNGISYVIVNCGKYY